MTREDCDQHMRAYRCFFEQHGKGIEGTYLSGLYNITVDKVIDVCHSREPVPICGEEDLWRSKQTSGSGFVIGNVVLLAFSAILASF